MDVDEQAENQCGEVFAPLKGTTILFINRH
jgi:hypothetical protein